MSSISWPYIAEKVAARLTLIEPYVHRRQLPLPPFRLRELDAALVDAPFSEAHGQWATIDHESYWGRGDLNFLLKSSFTVPEHWNKSRLALHLPLGVLGDIFNHPEALVHIDNHTIGSADRYHHTLMLDASLADGQSHDLVLHGWTGHTGWPIDRNNKAKLFMGTCCLVERDPALHEFVGLARAALDTVGVLSKQSEIHHKLLAALNDAVITVDTRDPGSQRFYNSVAPAHAQLIAGIESAGEPLDVTLHAIGHAHMDIAYLWRIDQIRLKNARTYSNVLRLMDQDADFKFSHSQPQLYAMTAQDYPDIFARIKQRVLEGRWEVMGGMWVEADLNIPGPESLVRQLTLGRQYFQDQFGDVETPVLWLPDTFGFPGQTPQLMCQAGLRWFATNKLNWNQFNKVSPSSHHWEGIDGTRVLAHILTSPRPVQYLPFPTNYKSDLSAVEVLGTWTYSTTQCHVSHLPICYGYGDGGGGPTEELLLKARAYQAMPGMPRLKTSTVRETFESLEACAGSLGVCKGEHYMEGHRGVYTSQAWIKRANRKAEWALHEAEALNAMAGISPDLTKPWQLLCLNQFHDIITGTSITEVFTDAKRDFATIFSLVEASTSEAARLLSTPTQSVANTSPVCSPRVVEFTAPSSVIGQATDNGVLAYFPSLPAYSITPASQAVMPDIPVSCQVIHQGVRLENQYVLIEVAPNGELLRVYDKEAERDVVAADNTANQLQAFEDRPISWDAWDIDPDFEDRQDNIDEPGVVDIIENGPIRASVCISRSWRSSEIVQTLRLHAHSKRLDFDTRIDWHETHTLLKAAFPTAVMAKTAQFDIQWGQIERSTQRDTAFDVARFEVPAHKWAMISDKYGGVALLNDCKYGYDVRSNTLRLSLIKSATSPDSQADQGSHQFTYSLLPLLVSDRERLDQSAYDLNVPLRVLNTGSHNPEFNSSFVVSSSSSVIVETLKPAADGQGIVVRLFQSTGKDSDTVLTFAKPILRAEECNLDESCIRRLEANEHHIALALRAFEIISVRVEFSGPQGLTN